MLFLDLQVNVASQESHTAGIKNGSLAFQINTGLRSILMNLTDVLGYQETKYNAIFIS